MKSNRIISYKKMTGIIIAFIIGSLFSLIIPVFVKKLVDYAIYSGKTVTMRDMVIMIFVSFLVFLFNFYFIQYIREAFIWSTNVRIKKKIFDKALNLPTGDFLSIDDGMMFNYFTNDSDQMASVKVKYLISFFAESIFLLVIIGILFFINYIMALIVIILIPIYVLSLKLNSKRVFDSSNEAVLAQDKAIKTMKNFISNLTQMEKKDADFYQSKFGKRIDYWIDSKLKFEFWRLLVQRLPQFISAISPIIILWVGAKFVKNNTLTLGTLLMFNQYMMMMFSPINSITSSYVESQGVKPSEDRINNFLSYESNLKKAYDKIYLDTNRVSLEDSKITVPTGLMLYEGSIELPSYGLYVIKGANGSGKSTLLNYLAGFANESQLEKVNLRLPRDFKDNISFLRYPLFFFENTVKENILFGDDREILNLFNITDLEKEVSVMPLNLSSGEAQKIALTRVFSTDKKYLFLDEPTSNLEKESVNSLVNYLKNRKSHGLILAIMHDETFDEIADGFIKIEDGKLFIVDKEGLC